MPDLPDVLTPKQVAKYLNVDVRTVYKITRQGRIPAFKVGNLWRYRKSDIQTLASYACNIA